MILYDAIRETHAVDPDHSLIDVRLISHTICALPVLGYIERLGKDARERNARAQNEKTYCLRGDGQQKYRLQ